MVGDTSNISIPSIFTTHTTAKLLTSLLPGIMSSAVSVDSPTAPALTPPAAKDDGENSLKTKWVSSSGKHSGLTRSETTKDITGSEEERDGLWITLTPSTMSGSPFFDTLLVLVISPLVTLSVVYGQWILGCFLFMCVWLTLPTALLLVRSMVRRRSWRAPKSVVDRLPVRTYQSIPTTTTTPNPAPAPPPQQAPTQPHPLRSSSLPTSDSAGSPARSPSVEGSSVAGRPKEEVPRRSKYMGGAVECVVCLEEYVDGISQVMKLPCGHEFHATCMFVPRSFSTESIWVLTYCAEHPG